MGDTNKNSVRINELMIGDKVTTTLVLVSIRECTDALSCEFKDSTGIITGTVSNMDMLSLKSQIGGAVKVTAVVKPGENRKPMLSIKNICVADKSEYRCSELFDGLSKEKIAEYMNIIHTIQRHIKHPGYKALVEAALNDVNLEKLSQMPATLGYYGRYRGGALAGAACIAEMVKQVGCTYVTHYNGLHAGNIDWSLLLTASLLNTLGVINYITPEPPFNKTPVGIERGYVSVLQSIIEKTIYSNNLDISDLDVSRLLNTIGCSVSKRTAVRATSKEGILLRHALSMYAELDMFDFGLSEMVPEEDESGTGYVYNPSLNRYVNGGGVYSA